jgi:xanthine dehydrogenase accessory factor
MRNIRHLLLHLIHSGANLVLATVVRASGSTPQRPGSSALFGKQGLLAGTVGGGHLENEVGQICESALDSGISGQYFFNLNSSPGEDGAICGGEAEVLVDAHPARWRSVLENLERSLAARKPGVLMTCVSGNTPDDCLIDRYWFESGSRMEKPRDFDPEAWETVSRHLSEQDVQGFAAISPSFYLETIAPEPRLLIAGAGHVGKALAHLAKLLDFEITMIDDRPEFANREQIPDSDHFKVREIGPAVRESDISPDTYVVIVTHGHQHDAEALKACIDSDAAYVGMIGSRHKVATLKKEFLARGWATEDQWKRIHTPIGIDIGSKTVQEIALSIAAELVQVRSKKTTAHAH